MKRLSYKHCVPTQFMFYNAPISLITTSTKALNKMFKGDRHKYKIYNRVFTDLMMMVFKDVITNNVIFKEKTSVVDIKIYLEDVSLIIQPDWSLYKALGYHKDKVLYQPKITFNSNATITVLCSNQLKQLLYQNILQSKIPIKKTTKKYLDYINELGELYPLMDRTDITHILRYGFRAFNKLLMGGHSITLKKDKVSLLFGSVIKEFNDESLEKFKLKEKYTRTLMIKRKDKTKTYIRVSEEVYNEIVNNNLKEYHFDIIRIDRNLVRYKYKFLEYIIEIDYHPELFQWYYYEDDYTVKILDAFTSDKIKLINMNYEKVD